MELLIVFLFWSIVGLLILGAVAGMVWLFSKLKPAQAQAPAVRYTSTGWR